MSGTYKTDMKFEAEVRYIAEAVWSLSPGECQPSHYPDDPIVREIDGIARLRDVTHLIMVTTSTKLDKIKDDVKKLNSAESKEISRALAVSKWLITQKQIDAQHIEHAKKNNVTVLTLEQFKHRFFDGRSYLRKRIVASFGSARNPSDNSITINVDAYVPLPIELITKNGVRSKRGEYFEEIATKVTIKDLEKFINEGSIVVLLAPFGAGKSLTTRELFKTLSSGFQSKRNERVPICLNLREHWGQDYFDEILERHARSIGFNPKEDLVIAWRSGMGCILLDGFDEVASQTVIRKDNVNFMRDARRVALTGVRDFFTKLPSGTGGFICGRDHYFDNDFELAHTLGIQSKEYKIVRLGEFTEEGANEFLRKNGVLHPLPDWLPRKPLILSYLIQNNLLSQIMDIDSDEGYGYAWDQFITKITQRESDSERTVMDAHTLRCVMERLAFMVRSLTSGDGPITGNDLASSYTTETGQPAGEGVLAQLQRLPGLTQRSQEEGSRSFIDMDMLAALQGGAMARIIWGQYQNVGEAPLSHISEKASYVAAYLIKLDGGASSVPLATAKRLAAEFIDPCLSQLAADCLSISIVMSRDEGQSLDCHDLQISSALLGELNLEENELINIHFNECLIDEVTISSISETSSITFTNCMIKKVNGVASQAALPDTIFLSGCEIEEFDDVSTNNAVLKLDITPQTKALLTILRKLYRQSGAGRKVGTLSRGITQNDVLKYIPSVLDVLEKQGFVRLFNQVVHPVRKKSDRAEAILNAPSLSNDPLVGLVEAL